MSDIKIVLQVDANNPIEGDLYLENGSVRLTASLLEEVSQNIRIGLRLFQGEWFLDPTQGVPYWQDILGQKTPLAIVSQILRNAVSIIPGISQITSFQVSRFSSRQLQLEFACTLADGTLLLSTDFTPFIIGV